MMGISRRQFLKGSALAAGALVVPWPKLDREPATVALWSSHDGAIAHTTLLGVTHSRGRWDAADVTFFAVYGFPFDEVRIFDADGGCLATIPLEYSWTPMGGDVTVFWSMEGLPI